jgi:hypothetical protein
MTDIEAKALALVNEIEREEGENELTTRIMRGLIMDEALCRAIEQHEADKVAHSSQIYAMHSRIAQAEEQHEAFKQKVSDAAKVYNEVGAPMGWEGFDRFIIPKPDPLADVLADTFGASLIDADELRAALEARGLEIREKGQ